MTTAIVKREEFPSPLETIEQGTAAANALSKVVEQKNLFKMIGEKKYLVAEAWQTICALDYAAMVPEWTKEITDANGQIVAYKARVNIVKGEQIISSGEMICGLEEFPCRGKEGFAKHRAAMSSAQTWAGAKAARMKYAWVVTLAGYAATPAEEMPGAGDGENPEESPYWCPDHSILWFKRGKMRGYAHPIGEGRWCNMPAEAPQEPQDGPQRPAAKSTPQGAPHATPAPTGSVVQAAEAPGTVVSIPMFKDRGDWFTRVYNATGWRLADLYPRLGIHRVEEITPQNWDALWAQLMKQWKEEEEEMQRARQ